MGTIRKNNFPFKWILQTRRHQKKRKTKEELDNIALCASEKI